MQANSARVLAIRKGPWKLIESAKGGPQLYNLNDDPGETDDLAARRPDRVRDLSALLAKVRQRGRSRF